jgi:dihydroneopterin aldolase
MTLLHVSVRRIDEALLALRHGADGIHVAEGSPDAIAAAVAGRAPVTVNADGDEAMLGGDTVRRVRAITLDGFDPAAAAALAAKGYSGVMLDAGQGTRLFDRTDIGVLAGIVDAARGAGLTFGISGALEPPDIPRLLLLAPDVLRLDRRPFRAGAIDAVRALIPAPAELPDELDVRRRASRREEPTDRVFVRDIVLPMQIGVYAREHGQMQRVRFDVDVCVTRQSHAPADMRDIFSYDIITDLIRMIAAREHVALVEGLAETIAARLLMYPRVASVTVRVEKLDTGPGGVGIEITRERPAEAATVLTLPRIGEGTT